MAASRVAMRLSRSSCGAKTLPNSVRARSARITRQGHLLRSACTALLASFLLCGVSCVHGLFGFGGDGKKGNAPSANSGSSDLDEGIDACFSSDPVPGDVVPPSSAPDPWKGRGSPWEDEETGEVHIIRASRDPYGLWKFPEGTVVPKDPTSMARIISVSNALGESFQCLIPARRKPPNPAWLDVPQVPVMQAIDTSEAQHALSKLQGKCFYRQTEYWTYEFCYKQHVRQFRLDPNSKKVVAEHFLGYYNASTPFEVYTAPDRTDHTMSLDQDGPAWTTALVTVYGGGEGADQIGRGWYQGFWKRMRLLGIFPVPGMWMTDPHTTDRPRQVAVKFKCLQVEEPAVRLWMERAAVYLDKDHQPFDIQVFEVAHGLYELTLRSEALCEENLLYTETAVELSPFGDLEEEVVCQSESSGQVYKLKDVPNDDSFFQRFKQAYTPFHK